MTQVIRIKPSEGGTAVVSFTLADENGTALFFAQLKNPQWQLMNTKGDIINDRDFASSNMTSLDVVLSGADLLIAKEDDTGERFISFQGSYDSSIGNDLSVTAEASFFIDDLMGQNKP